MATASIHGTMGPQVSGREESRREHDFYRYFEPIRNLTEHGPTYCDVRDAQTREQHKVFSCPDKTLTAFCQLGALRLNVRRCMLFFFDVSHAYVMAEATRSLSLEKDTAHDQDDTLWLGHAKIPRNVACCEITVNLPVFTASTIASSETSRNSVFVVNDLTKNPQTKDQPYVTSYPNGRFYAGVPITSPAGINIGAYCVLGDEPRDGVSEKEISFLQDMSRTVMSHLETLRAVSERQRATEMVTGLGAFVQGFSDSRRRENKAAKRKARSGSSAFVFERTTLHTRRKERMIQRSMPETLIATRTKDSPQDCEELSDSPPEYFDTATVRAQEGGNELSNTSVCFGDKTQLRSASLPDHSPSSSPDPSSQACGGSRICKSDAFPHNSLNGPPMFGRHGSTDTTKSQSTPKPRKTPDASERRPRNQRTNSEASRSSYQRASEIMCESLSVDGVAFVDATVGTFAGLADGDEAADLSESSALDESDSASVSSDLDSTSETAPCQVLGCVMAMRDGNTTSAEKEPARKLTERILRRLLRRHPYGKVWTFDENGCTHSDDAETSEKDVLQYAGAQRRQNRLDSRRHDGEMLHAMFPGARTIAIHGIRDQYHRRFTAGCILWSFDPLRVLTTNTEMNFVAAFCDIIVGENRRLEAQRSDKAKSDFISGVSHELRSPLHGILGSTEILKESNLDSMTTAVVEQIDACGRTLLDIIDHLLDFATLKGQKLIQGAVSSSSIGKMLPGTGNSIQGDLAQMERDIALDEATEEVMESTVYSFFCKKTAEERARTSVILDIDRSPDINWHCRLASGGWKRICMNLVANALKYTDSGYVRISLQQKRKSRQRFDALLTVADSGKGMSKAFVAEDLFRDFAQEDTNAEGMGLGMNMVGRMVDAMGGSINVKSDQMGSGTRILVTVPLERHQARPSQDDNSLPKSAPAFESGAFSGTAVGIVLDGRGKHLFTDDRTKQLKATASALAIASIEKTCKYLGLEAVKGGWDACSKTKVNFMLEEDFVDTIASMQSDPGHLDASPIRRAPSVVICKNSPSAETLLEAWRKDPHYPGIVTEYIASPCSISTISLAVSSALRRFEESRDSLAENLPSALTTPRWDLPSRPKDAQVAYSSANAPLGLDISNDAKAAAAPTLPPRDRPNLPAMRSSSGSLPEQAQSLAKSSAKGHDPNCVQPPTISGAAVPILLLVDDNPVNLRLLVAYAKKRKYPYLTAENGQLAIDAYAKAHGDSLSPEGTSGGHINMPVLDGYQATQGIRLYERKYHLPASKIIALTALGSPAAHKEAFGSGCDLFMTKPVKLKSLTGIIENVNHGGGGGISIVHVREPVAPTAHS